MLNGNFYDFYNADRATAKESHTDSIVFFKFLRTVQAEVDWLLPGNSHKQYRTELSQEAQIEPD